MSPMPRLRAALVLAPLLLLLASANAMAQAPPPPAAPTTGVLAILSVKADVQRADITKVLPNEVRETVRLYLDGKISQWFGRSDGRGVVFIINSTSVADAKAITDTLPLVKANLATFEFMALGPLTPLRALIAEPTSAPKQ